jgi:16S rRNA (cytosine967-C5)-methyltransferase
MKSRKKYLFALWKSYLQQNSWHQFDKWLEKEFKKYPFFGKRDRAFYSNYLYAALRFSLLAVWILRKKNKVERADLLELSDVEDFWAILEVREGFSERLFEFSSQIHNDCLLQIETLARSQSFSDALIYNGVPEFFLEEIKKRAELSHWNEEQLKNFVKQIGTRAPVWLRFRSEELKEEFKKNSQELWGKEVFILEERASALSLQGKINLKSNPLFEQGAFEFQDIASQEILSYLEKVNFDKTKIKIWDACAGGGGKTLQLINLFSHQANYWVSDKREYMLDALQKRVDRLGTYTLNKFYWDGEASPPESFDFILLDAPCTSSGVLRRNPELRWKITQSAVLEHSLLQKKLLSKAASSLSKNGVLCYSTCSFFVEENEAVVKEFLAMTPHFSLLDMQIMGNPLSNGDTTFAAFSI